MEHYVIKPAGEAGEAAVHAGLRDYNSTFVSDTAAPGFYEKLGYRRFGAVEPAVGEYGHYFYVKEL